MVGFLLEQPSNRQEVEMNRIVLHLSANGNEVIQLFHCSDQITYRRGRELTRLFAFYRFMSRVFSLGAKIMCNLDMSGSYLLSYHQKLCRENPDVIINIGKGAKLGIEECQEQMENERWNCSTVEQDISVFGKVMQKG